ncbi:molybdopterin-guanine dinucleotide biosynthesis protein B [Virgibacillus halophilus]|uniref:Molybdopterin-guanine dinucleotide biosynthesis protein B n=1 Tax=Tigheibacillus halophilus TaxID=361280 RepID=A0ABU5C9R1_9BACI|nr:molybdopterin-guanine dinucleotide biosynthesis protein B [Virgibacillus halophilus]
MIQVVGYKNAGKTTLISELISCLTARNYRVATLKHHGHESSLQTVGNTDSTKHHQAGAFMAGVRSSSEFLMHIDGAQPLTMKQIMTIYAMMDIDILLLEGFKQAEYPKIVLLREETDKTLLQLSNIIAIGAKRDNLLQNTIYETFSLNDLDKAVPRLADLCLANKEI